MTTKIVPIYPAEPYFTATCRQCGVTVRSDTGFADLNGKAFESYYCPTCAKIGIDADGKLYFRKEAANPNIITEKEQP